MSKFYFPEMLTIWFGLHNPDRGIFGIFAGRTRNRQGGKSNSPLCNNGSVRIPIGPKLAPEQN